MTVEADIFATLQSLVAGRVYPDMAPSGAAVPYIVFQEISGDAPFFLERAIPSKKHGRFQLTVWAATRMESAALILQVEEAMTLSVLFQAKPIGGRTAMADEEDTQLRGTRQDFSVWSDR